MPKMKRHGADMLRKVGTYEEIEKLKEKEKTDETKETQEEGLRQTFLHTSMLIHTNVPHITVVLHTGSLPHQHFYTQSGLHTNTVTHKPFI